MIQKIKNFIEKRKSKRKIEKLIENIDKMYSELKSDVVCIEVGSDIVDFVEEVLDVINEFRIEIKNKTGFIFQPIRVRDNSKLQENEYVVKIYEKIVLRDFVIPTKEKIRESLKDKLNEMYLENIEDIFTCEIMNKYIVQAREKNYYLVWNLTNTFSIYELKMIFILLLKNKKSIYNLSYIMEKIGQMTYGDGNSYCNDPIKVANNLVKIL